MAAYRWVYDSRRLQTDCQEPGSAPERSIIEYGLPLPFTRWWLLGKMLSFAGLINTASVRPSAAYHFARAAVAVDSSHVTAPSSASFG